ncbi:MAG: L-histidine N(alpha)-methyltransferase [Hyphomicrobiaceae bacterium]|nr:MAG: L-histidine N(alpha)-methyltransferase [Hyphomicrobiaceae bacterium]
MTRHERNIRAQAAASHAAGDFACEVIAGLSASYKRLPCRYFYDAPGSRLFEEITALDEYYPTRTETAILRAHGAGMAKSAGRGAALIEFGSGSSRKTELLLAALEAPRAYVPIDVSIAALDDAVVRLRNRMPRLKVIPVHGDFCEALALPSALLDGARLGFFPGSTIGNFDPASAVRLLRHFGGVLGAGARFIVGVDLEKNPQRLIAAYNDAKGVTAQFNLNLLARINRELGGDFDLSRFRHVAIYDQQHKRIEMHLVSLGTQNVRVLGHVFSFAPGESIHTENSYKYSIERFQALAGEAGWRSSEVWLDARRDFSVHELILPGAA